MSFKTIIIIILSILITVIFMQNTDQVLFTILWKELYVSKLIMMLVVTLFGFIIGVIVARPKKKKQVIQNADVPLEVTQSEDKDYIEMPKKQGISDEDRDYLN
jgi:uncharacterized integral membrane protein